MTTMRTLIDIPDTQIEALATLSARENQSRAALIREAIAEYLARHRQADTQAAFGLWGAEAEDGVAYQDRLRAEW
jgi:metal-responsive CopG/Arc/MetJ family transcriptional regulator